MQVDVMPAALPADAADATAAPGHARPNLVVWVAIVIPLIAVLASIGLVFSSLREAEPELPANYAWEGKALDQDLARARLAHELGASVGLEFATDGRLVARLAFLDGSRPLPRRLVVHLTHSTLPALDRRFELALDPASGTYSAALAPLQRGRWLIEIADGDGAWRVRERFLAPAAHVGVGL